tara:strand:+ start:15269 stop:16096 length:828 start_codon:yes stop_codon:yes gene_type:complete
LVKENLLKLDNSSYIIVNVSVASIYRKPNFSSELITQALIWEKLFLIEKNNNWFKIRQRDGYEGWIHSFYTVKPTVDDDKLFSKNNNWYWVKDRILHLLEDNNLISSISYGSLIPCFQDNEDFFTRLPNKRYQIKINRKSLISYNDEVEYKKNIKNSVKELIGVPYLWGGKSSFGFDCSGLLQSILNTSNIKFLERDTSQQILSSMLIKKNSKPNIGDIVFFKMEKRVDHVGIYINNSEFIHSSGCVKINSIDKENKYYSSKLEVNLYGIYKINV